MTRADRHRFRWAVWPGAVDGFPGLAKWLMIAGMLVGRLELLSVYVLFMVRFWRA